MSIFLIKTLQLLGALSILVFVHELGHFTFAKLFKMRVDKFYLFFDWNFSLFKFKPKNSDTEYGIGWLPLGGYCKIAGMVDESMDTKGMGSEPKPWEFRAKPAWQRLLVMAGGVIFNIIFATLIYAGLAYFTGEEKMSMSSVGDNIVYSEVGHQMGFEDGDLPLSIDGKEIKEYNPAIVRDIAEAETIQVLRKRDTVTLSVPIDLMKALIKSQEPLFALTVPPIIHKVFDHSEAEKAGLRAQDRFLKAAGNDVHLESLVSEISAHSGDTISFLVLRDSEEVPIIAKIDAEKGLGVQFVSPKDIFGFTRETYNLGESAKKGISNMNETMVSYAKSLKYLFTKEGASQIGGLGSIGNLFPQQFTWVRFWSLTALLSIILAVMNILPIPALDGGHILFLLIEVVTGRQLPIRFLERAQMLGLFLLLALMIYANVNDLFKFLF